jgi:hypothetical protein
MTKEESEKISKSLRRFGVYHTVGKIPPKGNVPQYEIRIGTQSEFVFSQYTACLSIIVALEIERRK